MNRQWSDVGEDTATKQLFAKLMTGQLGALEKVLLVHKELTESLTDIGLLDPQQACLMWADSTSGKKQVSETAQESETSELPVDGNGIVYTESATHVPTEAPAVVNLLRRPTLADDPKGVSHELRKAFHDYKGTGKTKPCSPTASSFAPQAQYTPQRALTVPLLANQARGTSSNGSRVNDDRPRSGLSEWTLRKKSERHLHRLAEAAAVKEATTLFPDAEQLKKRVLMNIAKPEYKVEDLYSNEGWAQALAKNEIFQNFTLAVIVFNVFWISIDTDYNKATILCEAEPLFQIVNNLFCLVFTFEIVVRFWAFANKCNALTEAWFVFDFFLVFFMAWETWVSVILYLWDFQALQFGGATNTLRIFRMARLTRVARLARVLRNAPELMVLIKGMVIATRSVVATLVLLLLIIYVFAVLLTQQLSGTGAVDGCFETVPSAMNCLLLNGVFTEEREFIGKMLDVDWPYYCITIVYLLLASLTVCNMLIGVLCEVVSVTASIEKEDMMLQDLKRKIMMYIPGFNADTGEGAISKEGFVALMENQEAVQMLHEFGIDIVALVDFADFIYKGHEELDMKTFMEKILQCRGANQATVKDITDMRMFLLSEISDSETRMLEKQSFE